MRRVLFPVLFGSCLLAACGGAQTTRIVDTPTGTAVAYGAPRDTVYEVEIEPAKDVMRVHVYEYSRCDVIPLQLVHRERETLQGDEVVRRESLGKKQVAGAPEGEVRCNQTYARDVDVSLVVGGAVHPIGTTDREGRVAADLSKVFDAAAYAEAPPAEATVRIRPQRGKSVDGATIRLTELENHEERVDALLAELEAILAKGETGASDAEIARSYELYAQLHTIAWDDPRVRAVAARFWELFYGRKQEEAREKMTRNLQALEQAKELLAQAGDAAIPMYVQAAINSGYQDPRTVEWSTLRLIRALRGSTVICREGFSWGATSALPIDARIGSSYLRYAHGDGYDATINRICTRF